MGWAGGNPQGDGMLAAILKDRRRYGSADSERPLALSEGPRKAVDFTWQVVDEKLFNPEEVYKDTGHGPSGT